MIRWIGLAAGGLAGVISTLAAPVGCSERRPTDAAPVREGGVAASVPLSLARVVVIGASVSAGSEANLPEYPANLLEGDTDLAGALAAVAGEGVEPPTSLADMWFFQRPAASAAGQAARAAALEPTVVFALDYLFWQAYGVMGSDTVREAMFEEGLRRLEGLCEKSAVVVADLPDMSHAVGLLLSASQVPSAEVQERLNERLREWAAGRPNVVVVPLRVVVAGAMSKGEVTLGGREFSGVEARRLLSASGLHASAAGLVAVVLECLERMQECGVIGAGTAWERDFDVVMGRLVERRRGRDGQVEKGGY